jgi:hypothetical protein
MIAATTDIIIITTSDADLLGEETERSVVIMSNVVIA